MQEIHETEDTIAALSTPAGEGGIAIVRISGKRAVEIGDKVLSLSTPLKESPSHVLRYGAVRDHNGKSIDEVLVSLMLAPRSYTREDTVEINCHAGVLVAAQVLEAVLRAGARTAGPGEFTKRAFMNGRIDLTRAEAVAALIRARTDTASRAAHTLLRGALADEIDVAKKILLEVAANLEAMLDFSEDEIEPVNYPEAISRLAEARSILEHILSTERHSDLLNQGARIAIVGKPNVGKSSLFNALVGKERAIIDEEPGTTRDTVEGSICAAGTSLLLIDTAGIRDATLTTERSGVMRSWEAAGEADLVLWVIDGHLGLSEDDIEIARRVRGHAECLAVANKMDLGSCGGLAAAIRAIPWNDPWLEISALNGNGIDQLKTDIVERLCGGNPIEPGRVVIGNARQAEKLRQSASLVREAEQILAGNAGEEIASQMTRDALMALGELTGEDVSEELLETIFSTFCVGK